MLGRSVDTLSAVVLHLLQIRELDYALVLIFPTPMLRRQRPHPFPRYRDAPRRSLQECIESAGTEQEAGAWEARPSKL
jgi:hypothetical protein